MPWVAAGHVIDMTTRFATMCSRHDAPNGQMPLPMRILGGQGIQATTAPIGPFAPGKAEGESPFCNE